jgi:hypothetical protein
MLRASLLVDKARLPALDRAIEQMQEKLGSKAVVGCVGPLPPFSFADVQLPDMQT